MSYTCMVSYCFSFSYDRHTVELLCSLTQILTNLPEHCKSIESLREFNFKEDPNMVGSLTHHLYLLVTHC